MKISGVSTARPNPLNSTVVFDVSGAKLQPRDRVVVYRDGSPLPESLLTITASRVVLRGGLIDGLNKLELEAIDSAGGLIDETFRVWAGSRTLTVLVMGDKGDFLPDAAVRAVFDEDGGVFAIGATDRRGLARLENLPAKQVVHLIVSAKDYLDREMRLVAVETAATIQLDVDNNDFHLGLKGWEVSDPKHVRIVPHSEESRPLREVIGRGRDTPRAGAIAIPPGPPMLFGVRYALGPVDAAMADPVLAGFRERVRALARAEDLDGLAGVAEHPAQLRAALATRDGWRAFRDTLNFGGFHTDARGAVEGRHEFCTPYFYSTYLPMTPGPAGEGDLWIVTGGNVPVRAAPSAEAELFGTFDHDLVRVTGKLSPADAATAWREVIIPDGRPGWVDASQLRRLDDFRACFVNKDGTWLVSGFWRGPIPARPR